jgi:hypothetical protein
MREETTGKPTNFSRDGIVEDCLIGRIVAIFTIVRTINAPVKCRTARGGGLMSFGFGAVDGAFKAW